jgi:hypothetical protein
VRQRRERQRRERQRRERDGGIGGSLGATGVVTFRGNSTAFANPPYRGGLAKAGGGGGNRTRVRRGISQEFYERSACSFVAPPEYRHKLQRDQPDLHSPLGLRAKTAQLADLDDAGTKPDQRGLDGVAVS